MNSKNSSRFSFEAGALRLRRRFLPAWALMAVAATVLGGCQLLPPAAVDATRFFVLTGPAIESPAEKSANGRLQIGLRPVELPAYLRATKSMVVREGANEIRYQDFSRWAEPLETGVNRILRERLLASPDVRGVQTHPFAGDLARDFDVRVRVIRCEGTTAGKASAAYFAASYEIVAADSSGKVVASRTFTAPDAAWDGKDFSALAERLSDGVAALSAQIAADLPK